MNWLYVFKNNFMENKKMNKLKWKRFDDEVIEKDKSFFPKTKIISSAEKLCKFVDNNDIEIVSISCRWCFPTDLFYREKDKTQLKKETKK